MNFEIDAIRWKDRFPASGVDAGEAYGELERLRAKKGGTYTASDVVAQAKARKSKLHPLFEWDDTVAAREHRLTQARSMLRALEVTYKEGGPKEPRRAIEIVAREQRSEGNRSSAALYSTTEEAMADSKSREALLAVAIQQLMSLRKRFRQLNEMDRIFEAIDEFVDAQAS